MDQAHASATSIRPAAEGFGHEPLLTPREVAHHLRVDEDTLTAWRCTGREFLPYVKVGRLVRYRPADLATFVAERLRGLCTQ